MTHGRLQRYLDCDGPGSLCVKRKLAKVVRRTHAANSFAVLESGHGPSRKGKELGSKFACNRQGGLRKVDCFFKAINSEDWCSTAPC
jgi:hypothetical protein